MSPGGCGGNKDFRSLLSCSQGHEGHVTQRMVDRMGNLCPGLPSDNSASVTGKEDFLCRQDGKSGSRCYGKKGLREQSGNG